MNKTNINKPRNLVTQYPLDIKKWFINIHDLMDLGIDNERAYKYYNGMFAYNMQTNSVYRWVEWDKNGSINGLLPNGFTYPDCYKNDMYDYSNKTFNFVKINIESADNELYDEGIWARIGNSQQFDNITEAINTNFNHLYFFEDYSLNFSEFNLNKYTDYYIHTAPNVKLTTISEFTNVPTFHFIDCNIELGYLFESKILTYNSTFTSIFKNQTGLSTVLKPKSLYSINSKFTFITCDDIFTDCKFISSVITLSGNTAPLNNFTNCVFEDCVFNSENNSTNNFEIYGGTISNSKIDNGDATLVTHDNVSIINSDIQLIDLYGLLYANNIKIHNPASLYNIFNSNAILLNSTFVVQSINTIKNRCIERIQNCYINGSKFLSAKIFSHNHIIATNFVIDSNCTNSVVSNNVFTGSVNNTDDNTIFINNTLTNFTNSGNDVTFENNYYTNVTSTNALKYWDRNVNNLNVHDGTNSNVELINRKVSTINSGDSIKYPNTQAIVSYSEALNNKSQDINSDTGSIIKYPSIKAVQDYFSALIEGTNLSIHREGADVLFIDSSTGTGISIPIVTTALGGLSSYNDKQFIENEKKLGVSNYTPTILSHSGSTSNIVLVQMEYEKIRMINQSGYYRYHITGYLTFDIDGTGTANIELSLPNNAELTNNDNIKGIGLSNRNTNYIVYNNTANTGFQIRSLSVPTSGTEKVFFNFRGEFSYLINP